MLDQNGNVLELYCPLSDQDRQRLVKEIRDSIYPIAHETASYTIEKALEPVKRQLLHLDQALKTATESLTAKMSIEI